MASLAARLLALAQAVGADIKALQTAIAGLGGGADPWTRLKLPADYTNPLATFADISAGSPTPVLFSYTPPANSDFIIEADLIILTTTTTNLPRIGVSMPAGMQWAAAEIRQAGATDAAQVQLHGGTTTASANILAAAGGLAVANSPRLAIVRVKGRSGANPGAIRLQMAAETAGANICYVKAGSEMRSRVIA